MKKSLFISLILSLSLLFSCSNQESEMATKDNIKSKICSYFYEHNENFLYSKDNLLSSFRPSFSEFDKTCNLSKDNVIEEKYSVSYKEAFDFYEQSWQGKLESEGYYPYLISCISTPNFSDNSEEDLWKIINESKDTLPCTLSNMRVWNVPATKSYSELMDMLYWKTKVDSDFEIYLSSLGEEWLKSLIERLILENKDFMNIYEFWYNIWYRWLENCGMAYDGVSDNCFLTFREIDWYKDYFIDKETKKLTNVEILCKPKDMFYEWNIETIYYKGVKECKFENIENLNLFKNDKEKALVETNITNRLNWYIDFNYKPFVK